MQASDVDFLIIGATKCATTWLQKSLQADPAVFMPDPELHYFSRNFDRGQAWYLAQFADARADQITGEKSNSYLDDPVAPPRVHALLPHARLVAQLRNPIERAYSDYCMLYRRGMAGRDIETALDTRSGTSNRFLDGGLYHRQLEAYLELFEKELLLVLFYEDMIADPAAHLGRARAFLELPVESPRPPVVERVKDRTQPMVGVGWRRALAPIRPLVEPFRHSAFFKAARRRLASEVAYPAFPPSLRARLVDFYASDVERLGALVGSDLSGWLAPDGRRTSFDEAGERTLAAH